MLIIKFNRYKCFTGAYRDAVGLKTIEIVRGLNVEQLKNK